MWLSIRFAQLPLEALEIKMGASPQAVIENNLIVCANQAAFQQGVKINQSLSTTYTLSSEIEIYERNLSQEKQRLNNMALLVYAYTPSVTIEEDKFLSAELGTSLKLHGGLEKLLASLTQVLEQENFSYQLGIGDTPKSAELLSHYSLDTSLSCWIKHTQIFNKTLLQKRLSEVPVSLLNISSKNIQQLHSVGVKNLDALRKLPFPSIRKRFGRGLSEYLLKLSGQLADPKTYITPKESFYEKIEFVDVIQHRQGLLFPIKRLISNLCRFLSIKQKNTQSLHWQLFDSEKNRVGFEVLISDSQISLQTYLELTQLNLEGYTLHAPIEAVSLTVDKLSKLIGETKNLFEQTETFRQDISFVNKIRAKLGNNSCKELQQINEHLPELSTQQSTKIYSSDAKTNQDMPRNISDVYVLPTDKRIKPNSTFRSNTSPSWLFEKPQLIQLNRERLIWRGELRIISHKERIVSNWWKKETVRDYFLAEHDSGVVYWIFFERVNKQWFIHGLYS